MFEIKLNVRDYELDMQGIVNNSVYFNYLEHARHEFLLSKGVDFADLTRQGIHLVVVRSELSYKSPLKSGDEFLVRVVAERISPIKLGFQQQVICCPDSRLCVDALVVGVALNAAGRPYPLPEADKLFA